MYTLLYPNPKLFWSIGEGTLGGNEGACNSSNGWPQTRKWVGEFMGVRSIQTLLKAYLTKVVKCPCIILFGWKFAKKKKNYENAWGLKKCTC